MAFATYKMTPRNISLEKGDLKRLIDYVAQKTRESIESQKREINFEDLNEEQRESVIRTLDEASKPAVFVYGSDGEELLVYDSSIIDAPEFPERLLRITIDSFIPYQTRMNGTHPRNGMRIDLDFSSAKILDWQSNVSAPTQNQSEVIIKGLDDDWRAAVHSFLHKMFTSRANHRNFLHAAFTYDVYLWLIFMPIYFLGMIKLDYFVDRFIGDIHTALKVAFYVYSFFVFVNLYRVFIGYIRWTFQSLELKNVQSTQSKHRKFGMFLVSAIIIPVLLTILMGK